MDCVVCLKIIRDIQWKSVYSKVMLTIAIQGEFVEHPSAGLLSDILVNNLASQLIKTDCVGEGFAGGLQRASFISRP